MFDQVNHCLETITSIVTNLCFLKNVEYEKKRKKSIETGCRCVCVCVYVIKGENEVFLCVVCEWQLASIITRSQLMKYLHWQDINCNSN